VSDAAARADRDAGRRDLVRAPLLRTSLRFGAPIAAALCLHGVFNLVDLLVIARLGIEGAPAAINVASILVTAPFLVFDGICNVAVALIAQAKGARDGAEAHAVARDAAWLAVAVSAATCFPFLPVAARILAGYDFGGPAAVAGGDYLRIMSLGAATMFLLLAATAALRGAGDSVRPMALLVGSNVLNLALTVAMVHGVAGFPKLETAGAAWATVISRGLAVGAAVWWLRRGAGGFAARGSAFARPTHWGVLSAKGLSSSAQLVIRLASFAWVLRIAQEAAEGQAGTFLDGVTVAQRLDMTAVFAAIGWGAAATTLVGQNLGAGRARRAGVAAWCTMFHSAWSVGLMALALWRFRDPLFSLIDPTLADAGREAGYAYLRLTLPFAPILAAGATLSRSLNGALDVVTPLIVDFCCYLVLLPLAAGALSGAGLFGLFARGGPNPEGVWIALDVAHVAALLAYVFCFRRSARRWRAKEAGAAAA